ncbi:MAG TPA: CbbY/CbbZ/GpH/YieH [Planctomycetes bacterium]|nr:CbbY/CbbZ/GpH/YieH [Planctomycetota bacterium]
MPAALLLDLDGTLLDTEPLHFEAHRRFLATVGIVPSEADLIGNIGKGDVTFYRDLMVREGKTGDPVAWVARKTAMLMDLYAERPVPMRAGTVELLDAAQVQGITCLVVTSSERTLAAAALASAGLSARLPMRVAHEDTLRHKPHPEPYLLAAVRLALSPQRCLAVEDSATGVASARTAGCRVVGVDGHIPATVLRQAGASRIIARLDALLPLDDA